MRVFFSNAWNVDINFAVRICPTWSLAQMRLSRLSKPSWGSNQEEVTAKTNLLSNRMARKSLPPDGSVGSRTAVNAPWAPHQIPLRRKKQI